MMEADAVYFVFFRNDLPQVAFALFEKNNKIILPNFYPLYSGIWLNGSLEKLSLRDDFIKSISELKKIYKCIKISVPPDIQDLRAFIWNGFDVELRYTYLKNISAENYKRNVLKNYRKANNEYDFEFIKSGLNDELWEGHVKQLSSIGFKNSNLISLRRWLIELEMVNLITTFRIGIKSKGYQGSGIVLLDKRWKNAGFLLSHVPKTEYVSLTNAFLHVQINNWLSDNKFESIDYLGANTKSIADFKSRFNPQLKSYFIVTISISRAKKILLWFKNISKNSLNYVFSV
nr:hypothetical protein [Pedobacter glucosidilyticus]